jgi:hypothetical protein
MKSVLTLLAFIMLATCIAPSAALASQKVSLSTARTALVKKTAEKAKSFKKDSAFLAKFKFKNAEAPIDFQSEPDKWMWFWIFAWGLAIVTSFLFFTGGAGFIPSLFYLAGLVFLIIWLVQKFS